MKKLIYIVLIVILLVLIGKYMEDKKKTATTAPDSVTVVEEQDYEIVDTVTGEIIGAGEQDIITTTSYDDENADGMIVEEDFVEENPEMTQDDDETIIAE